MGITEVFSDTANLNGLLDSGEQLKVSDVIHKAVIEINEKGSESAAATGKDLFGDLFFSLFGSNFLNIFCFFYQRNWNCICISPTIIHG